MAAPVAKGQELELRIDSLAYGGNGVARLDGFVVFVRGGLPGDLVRARVTKVKRGFAEAVKTAVLEPGPGPRRGAVPRISACAAAAASRTRLRAPGSGEGGAGARRAHPARRLRRPAGRTDRPGALAVRLPQQARVLVRERRRRPRARPRVPPRRPLGRGDRRRGMPAHDDLGNAIRDAVKEWAREEGLEPYDQERRPGISAISSCARAATRARCSSCSSPHRASSSTPTS